MQAPVHYISSYVIWTFQICASILAKVPFPVWDCILSIPHSVPTFLLSQIGVFDGFCVVPSTQVLQLERPGQRLLRIQVAY